MLHTLSTTYLEKVKCGMEEADGLGDLMNDAMVRGLLNGVESNSCEMDAQSLSQALEEGLATVNAQNILTKGSMWMGALFGNLVSHKRDIKDFIVSLNNTLVSYADMIIDIYNPDNKGHVKYRSPQMATSDGPSASLTMVSRVMENVLAKCELAEKQQAAELEMAQEKHAAELAKLQSALMATETKTTPTVNKLSSSTEPEKNRSEQAHPRLNKHKLKHKKWLAENEERTGNIGNMQPKLEPNDARRAQRHMITESEKNVQGEESLHYKDDIHGTELDIGSDAGMKSDTKAESELDIVFEGSSTSRPNQRKYNLRGKSEMKRRGMKETDHAENIDDEQEKANKSGPESETSSLSELMVAPLRKKVKRSIITK